MSKNEGRGFDYLFGPVPSRRLGRSLGVDIVPMKTCTLDCVYCQLGRTTNRTVQRMEYVPTEDVLADFNTWFSEGGAADYVTLSGSGEPTLHSRFGEIIRGIQAVTYIPVALLTNGTLLWDPQVRDAACAADILIPSLDAATAEGFRKVNRPDPSLDVETIIEGLATAKQECPGEMWLEVMLVEGVNDSPGDLSALREAIEHIKPDRTQINTPVRPAPGRKAQALDSQRLVRAQEALGPTAEIVAPSELYVQDAHTAAGVRDVENLLRRRPCTLDDIARGLGMHPNEVSKYVWALLNQGQISSIERGDAVYYILAEADTSG